jgi:hypothetical protein
LLDDVPGRIAHWYLTRPPHTRVLLVLATTVLVVEVLFRRFAPKSKAYKTWTKAFETIGVFWTAVILSIVYFLSVSLVALFMRLTGKDLLDRGLAPEKTYWKAHEPNPLGPKAAIRHQF